MGPGPEVGQRRFRYRHDHGKNTVAKVTRIVEKDKKRKNKDQPQDVSAYTGCQEMLFSLEVSGRQKPPPPILLSPIQKNNYILKWDDGRPLLRTM